MSTQTDRFTITPALSATSHAKACTAVVLPSSVWRRQTNPGALSAAAFTGSRAATKSASTGLSSGAQPSDVHLREFVAHRDSLPDARESDLCATD